MKQKTLRVIGIDGNAVAIMARYKTWARRSGVQEKTIQSVLKEAMSGDYEHLLAVISSNIEKYDDQKTNKNV